MNSNSFEITKNGNTIFRLVRIENIVDICYTIPNLESLDYSFENFTNWLYIL